MSLGSLSEERGSFEWGERHRAQRPAPREVQDVPGGAAVLSRVASMLSLLLVPPRELAQVLLCFARVCVAGNSLWVIRTRDSAPGPKGALLVLEGRPTLAGLWTSAAPGFPTPGLPSSRLWISWGLHLLAWPSWQLHLAFLIPLARVVDTRQRLCSMGTALWLPLGAAPSLLLSEKQGGCPSQASCLLACWMSRNEQNPGSRFQNVGDLSKC